MLRKVEEMGKKGAKPVYVYDVDGNLVKEFKTTKECAEYFDKERDYINHNLKYYKKIRQNDVWFILKRVKNEQ